MGLGHSPRIITENLVLLLDAANPKNYNLTKVEVLVVGGGGGGGGDNSGGGGGGGVISGSLPVTTSSYPISIGAGGAGGSGNVTPTGGDLTTALGLTAGGGGRGGRYTNSAGGSLTGGNGAATNGSGGGGSYDTSAGTGNGTGGNGNGPGGGGGGGAGASATNRHGGAGILNAILGTNYYWGGGGAGSAGFPNTQGNSNGGIGGGAATVGGTPGGSALNAGGVATSNGGDQRSNAAGGANTGGGGAGIADALGAQTGHFGGNGGDGIVIVRYPGPQKAIGGVVTSVGGDTIHTFTTSGNFTPLVNTNGSAVLGLSDLSGNRNFGTTAGGPTYSSANGGSLYFEGSDEYVTTGFTRGTLGNQTTLISWYKYTGTSGRTYSPIFGGKESGSGTEFFIGKNSGNTNIGVQDGNYYDSFVTGSNAFDGNYHQIVYTYDNGTGKIYLDGTLRNTNFFTKCNDSEEIVIGVEFEGGGYYFIGNISQVSIYNRALSAAEISQNFNALRGRFGI